HLGQDTKSKVVHCPYNTSHSMPPKTLVLHLTKCPDRLKNKKDGSKTSEKDDAAINQNQCMIKPKLGLTKTERKKYRVQAIRQYANVDFSYNPNLSIQDRLSSATSNGGNIADQRDQQIKKDGLSSGKRLNN
ncbi:gametocyte-specific factor 1, partial [Aphis craccivora]